MNTNTGITTAETQDDNDKENVKTTGTNERPERILISIIWILMLSLLFLIIGLAYFNGDYKKIPTQESCKLQFGSEYLNKQ